MDPFAFSLLVAVQFIGSASTPEQPAVVKQNRYHAADTCVREKAISYSRREGLALDLANLLALECAELLPQTSEKDCGKNQALCDQIQTRTNEEITAINAEMAYKMIVSLRQQKN